MIDYFICLLILHLLNLGRVIQSIDYYERIKQTFFHKIDCIHERCESIWVFMVMHG